MEFHYTWEGGRHFAPLLRLLRQGGFFEAPVYMSVMTVAAAALFLLVCRAVRRRDSLMAEGRAPRLLWYCLYFYVCWLATTSLAVGFKTMIVEELDYTERKWFEPYLPGIHFYVTSACLAYLALVVEQEPRYYDLPLALYLQTALAAGYGLAAYRTLNEDLVGAVGGALLLIPFAACNYDLVRRVRRGLVPAAPYRRCL